MSTFRVRIPNAVIAAVLVTYVAGGVLSGSSAATTGQKRRPPATKPAPAQQPADTQSPEERLDQARNAASADERISLLEKFVARERGTQLELEARDFLMREYALKGEQQLREGNAQQATQVFKKVLRAAPQIITDKVFGQFIFPLPVAMNSFGFRAESAELMRSFEPRFEDDPNRLVEIGFFYVQIEAPVEAARVLERAVQLAPDNHRAHNSLGTAYLIGLRLDQASAEFQKALELDAKDEFANLNLANVLRANGDYEKAISYYRRQLALKTDDAEAYGGLAIALLAIGRDEEAEPAIKRTMELSPADYRFLTQLAYFYAVRKKTDLARPLIERSLKIEPRFAWTMIVKANIDALEGKSGDALATLISAQQQAGFSTLTFELAKVLMTLDGYDQASEVFAKSFTLNEDGEFETMLGGALKGRSPRLDLLLSREREAAMFLPDTLTTSLQYRLAEALSRIDYYAKVALAARHAAEAKPTRGKGKTGAAVRPTEGANQTRPRRTRTTPSLTDELSGGSDANLEGVPDMIRAIDTFTSLDDGRQAFRMVWVSRKLTEASLALDAAELLARRALAAAEASTEPAGSMRDAPTLNRDARRQVFLGRAYDALGWALFKKGDIRGAVENLSKSVESYIPSAERQAALWRLAVATQEAGDERRALEFYIASYDPRLSTSAVRRAQIEALYKRLNGSLAGLEEKLKQQQ
jgi:tetratricopeptide (TPR) repeat protein